MMVVWWLVIVFLFVGIVFGSLGTAVYFLNGGGRWHDE